MSFEPLNSSLPLLAPESHVRKATCDPVVLAWESPIPTRRQSVNDRVSCFYCIKKCFNWSESFV